MAMSAYVHFFSSLLRLFSFLVSSLCFGAKSRSDPLDPLKRGPEGGLIAENPLGANLTFGLLYGSVRAFSFFSFLSFSIIVSALLCFFFPKHAQLLQQAPEKETKREQGAKTKREIPQY